VLPQVYPVFGTTVSTDSDSPTCPLLGATVKGDRVRMDMLLEECRRLRTALFSVEILLQYSEVCIVKLVSNPSPSSSSLFPLFLYIVSSILYVHLHMLTSHFD
jgi:hypothetical protein